MNAKELLERYADGERDFEGVNLSGVIMKNSDLTGINLKGAILSQSNLEKVTLNDANLNQCSFREARLSTVDFWDADLSEADFSGAYLYRVIFARANLKKTNFYSLVCLDKDCKFEGAKMTHASFKNTEMRYRNLSEFDLENCDFSETNLENANFSSANCKKVNFKRSNLGGAIFKNTGLEEANLKRANLNKANLMKSQLTSASFVGANLTDANLYLANYEEAELLGAIMPDGEIYDPENYSIIVTPEQSSHSQFIDTENAPKSPNSHHQAVIVNGSLHVAGQIAIDPRVNAMLCEDEITEQTRRVMENLTAILAAADAGWSDVVKTMIYMVDLEECDRMNSVYSEYFPDGNLPICTCVAVSQLPQNVRVQIECVAAV